MIKYRINLDEVPDIDLGEFINEWGNLNLENKIGNVFIERDNTSNRSLLSDIYSFVLELEVDKTIVTSIVSVSVKEVIQNIISKRKKNKKKESVIETEIVYENGIPIIKIKNPEE